MNSTDICIQGSLKIWPVLGSQEKKYKPNKRIRKKNI